MSSAPASMPSGDAAASRLASLLAAAPDSIFTFDADLRLLEFNVAAERTFGRSATAVIGRSVSEVILGQADSGAEVFRSLMAGLNERRASRVETLARRADGTEFPCEITIARFEENGRMLFTALLRDFTERRNVERQNREFNEALERQVAARTAELQAAIAALDHARARLEAAQEIAQVGDVEINMQTGTRVWSAEVFRLYGFAITEIAPSWDVVLQRIHPDDRERCNGMLADAVRGQVPEPVDYRVIHPGGAVRWIRATGRFTKGTLAITLADVTERKAAEEQLLAMIAREREFGRLKADFVYTITHEYRTPLSVVLSSAEILERYLDRLSPEERSMHVREIRMHARRLAELVDEVLFLGRMDAGTVELNLAPVDLRTICREVVESVVTALGGERAVHIAINQAPVRVLLDERLVRHVLSNLVHNALKYSPADRPVWVSVSAEPTDLVLRVRDEGIGIPAQDQARMFQSFQRASNVGAISGSGLGLVVVKRCVDMHGGSIQLQSTEGKGTEFTIRLPLTVPGPAVERLPASKTPSRSLPPGRKRPKSRKPAARKR